MKKFWRRLLASWQKIALGAVCLAVLIGLFTFHLGSLAPKLSPSEARTVSQSSHYEIIATNFLNAPQRGLVWLSLKLAGLPLIWRARLPSVLLALVCLGLMTYVLRRWYGRRSMVFGLVLFASSAWLLHVGRFAGMDIEYVVAPLALIASTIFVQDHEQSAWSWWLWLAVNLSVLLVPGMIWFVILNTIWAWRPVVQAFGHTPLWQRLASLSIPLAGIGELVVTCIVARSNLVLWLGLPAWPSLAYWQEWPQRLVTVLLAPFWQASLPPEIWIGGVPLLDSFVAVMFVAGVYFYARHWRAARARVLAAYLLLGVLVASLGFISVGTVVPIIYLIAVAGIALVLHAWLKVFPRNPLARSFGISLMIVLIGLSSYYNLTQYFIAWPHNLAVEHIYQSTP